MKQSRLESLIESTLNNGSGFLISILLFEYVVKPVYGSVTQNSILIVSMFTLVSMLRSYIWRRFFNNGLHKAVHQFVTELTRRTS